MLITHLSKVLYHWVYAKKYATRTQLSIGGVQDLDTPIEQTPNYSNRTFSRNKSWFCCGTCLNISLPIEYRCIYAQTIKCINLFTMAGSSTCAHYTWQYLIQAHVLLKMLSNSILYQSIFSFDIWEDASCAWLSESNGTFPLSHATPNLLKYKHFMWKCLSVLAFLWVMAPDSPSYSMFRILKAHFHPRNYYFELATCTPW